VKILTVVGNRPQFIKAAAVSGPLRAAHEEVLVHTGQHYDDSLSKVFFAELGLARPERELGIGGGSNTSQTARMLGALEGLIPQVAPDAVLVYGDTNSTLAGALAGAQARIPVVHVEAGMRSFDRTMPEELNRVLTDHMSDLLLCSSQAARENLAREGVPGARLAGEGTPGREMHGQEAHGQETHGPAVVVVGDVMVDVALRWQPGARENAQAMAERWDLAPGEYVLVTAHRAGNVDDPVRLTKLVYLLQAVAEQTPVLLPLHPRTNERLQAETGELWDELAYTNGVRITQPLGYAEFAALLCGARAVLTDSGGIQKEAYLAGVPCITLRANTEWVETVEAGWNTLVDLDSQAALAALERTPPTERPELYGDGHAAERCVAAIGEIVEKTQEIGEIEAP
jgi:UDP-N-acetylglucosamine 2-epimerase (non-hydrolysing)/UDP-GlcNAc3NAcA epimerase